MIKKFRYAVCGGIFLASDWIKILNRFSRLEAFFLLYIILQPILDLLNFFNIPVSQPVRIIAMIIGVIYLWQYRNKRNMKYVFIYLFILGLFMLANLINNILLKNPFSFTTEAIYDIKTAYFNWMLIIYLFVFRSISQKKDWQPIVQLYTWIAFSIIGVVMLIATLTGTGKRSYGFLTKHGHSGWFFSANELSAILAMGIGLTLLYVLGKRKTSSKLTFLPLILLIIWSMLMIGTKVALGGLVIILAVYLLTSIIQALLNRGKWANSIILAVLMVASLLITPFMPIGHNLNAYSPSVSLENTNEQQPQSSSGSQTPIGSPENAAPKDNSGSGALNGIVLSSRAAFLKRTMHQFKQAPISRKLLGMGYGADYSTLPQLGINKKVPKLIEMNFLDWFFDFGIIGFILLMIPMIYIGYRIIANLLKARFKQVNPAMIVVAAEVAIGLGVSFMAGHILSSPASGIYLIILICYFYALSQRNGYTK